MYNSIQYWCVNIILFIINYYLSRTAVDWAKKWEHTKVVELLESLL